jgi:hypothetical protein
MLRIDGKTAIINLAGRALSVRQGPGGPNEVRIMDGDIPAAALPADAPWMVTLDEGGSVVTLVHHAT